jgi:predicted CXXCH cytochrome family protein
MARQASDLRHLLYGLFALGCALVCLACGAPEDGGAEQAPAPLALAPPEKRIPNDRDSVAALLADSVHSQLDCNECHVPRAEGVRPGAQLPPAQCEGCHADEQRAYATSVHGAARARGVLHAATCSNCHGDHDILASADPESLVHKRRLPSTCGQCHQNPELAKRLGISNPEAASQYLDSTHGRMLVKEGLVVAPSCVDCHGHSHAIQPAKHADSTVNRHQLAATCGTCHEGARDAYLGSSHAKALMKDAQKAPVCTDCHSAHSIVAGSTFKLDSDRLCGRCHEKQLELYLETYHGRANDLGDDRVATCFDCHGEHRVLPASDPQSSVAPAHRLATCQQCHPGAPPKFAEFLPHADHTSREEYPVLFWTFLSMTGLLVGTFAFFGLHTLLWLVRSAAEYRRDPAAFRAIKQKARDERGARLFLRFRAVDRFCHLLIIVSFTLLVATGMPLKFHEAVWAQTVFDLLGGARVAASLHRFGAILTASYFIIHLLSLVGPLRRAWARSYDGKTSWMKRLLGIVLGPDSPVPGRRDVLDIRDQFKWFIGKGPRPRFDRFTYWEKFDYMAVFWGVTVIGLSGLVMWFPTVFSRAFPGWIVNVAQVIHSDEALLAAGFIFTFHFFHGHFRPEKFPIDTVMFSGRITEEELKHERPAQYERLTETGELEQHLVGDAWTEWKGLFTAFGAVALLVGVLLAAAIFVAIVGGWFH